MKKAIAVLACLAFLAMPLATASSALAQETSPEQVKKTEYDQLKKEIEDLRAKIKAEKESIEPTLAKLKTDREQLQTLTKKMKELREERRKQRKKWREEHKKKDGPAPSSPAPAEPKP